MANPLSTCSQIDNKVSAPAKDEQQRFQLQSYKPNTFHLALEELLPTSSRLPFPIHSLLQIHDFALPVWVELHGGLHVHFFPNGAVEVR